MIKWLFFLPDADQVHIPSVFVGYYDGDNLGKYYVFNASDGRYVTLITILFLL